MNATLDVAQTKLRAEIIRIRRRDRLALTDDLCVLLDCDEHELAGKMTEMTKWRDSLDNLRQENARLQEELKRWEEESQKTDDMVVSLREQLRALKTVMEEEEAL